MKEIAIRPYSGVLELHTSRDEYLARYNELSERDNSEAVGDCNGLCWQHGARYLVGVFDGGVPVLSHELTHVVFYEAVRTNFMAEVGDNDEGFAYLIQDLTKESLLACPEILTQAM